MSQMGNCVDEPKLSFSYPDEPERFKKCPFASISNFGWRWLKTYRVWKMRNFNFDMMQLSEAEIDLIFMYESHLADFTNEARRKNGKK